MRPHEIPAPDPRLNPAPRPCRPLLVLLLAALPAAAAGCAPFGASVAADPGSHRDDPDWTHATNFSPVSQEGRNDCGAAALSAVLSRWNLSAPPGEILDLCGPGSEGIRAGDLREFALDRGLRARLFRADAADLEHELSNGRPVLVGLAEGGRRHYEVVAGLHAASRRLLTLDPAQGWREWSWEDFDAVWSGSGRAALAVGRSDELDRRYVSREDPALEEFRAGILGGIVAAVVAFVSGVVDAVVDFFCGAEDDPGVGAVPAPPDPALSAASAPSR